MIPIKNLDIVITRSCQLNCSGCLVFSDHNLVKGHTTVESAVPWLEFWSGILEPRVLHLFGGEPLMHPTFVEWVEIVKKYFGKYVNLNVQTNGIGIRKFNKETLFYLVNDLELHFNITIHNELDWYKAAVNEGVQLLEECLPEGKWTNLNSTEREFRQKDGKWFRITEGINRPWVNHYTGHGYSLKPSFPFTSDKYTLNHGFCEAKEYIQLYEGNLYKCPVMATLKDTLSKYDYPNKDSWEPWLNYEYLPYGSDVDKIKEWLTIQNKPEQYCNMCFGQELPITIHTLKTK